MSGERRDYQKEAVPKLVNIRRGMSLLPPGAGKTVIGIDVSTQWPEGKVAIQTTVNGIGTWVNQIGEWYPELADEIAVVRGAPYERKHLWGLDRRYFISTYDAIRLDWREATPSQLRQFTGVIGDECHKRRNHRNATSKAYLHFCRYIPHLILTTGSHMMKGPKDLFALFQLINPRVFRSYWKFVNTFYFVEDGMFGKELVAPRNKEQLVDLILQYGYYRSREDIADQMPKKNRMPIMLEMSARQREVYDQIEDDMFVVLDGGIVFAPTKLTQLLRLRQLLVCPKILDPSLDMGSGFEDLLYRLEEQPHMHVVTPFTAAIPYLIEALNKAGYKDVYAIQGGMRPGQAQEIATQASKTRGIIISSLLAAESYSLSSCNSAYFLGYDYTPDANYQAEDRIVRADSESDFANIYYARYRGTIDDDVLGVVDAKVITINSVNHAIKMRRDLKKGTS